MDAWRQGYEGQYSAYSQLPVSAVEGVSAKVQDSLHELGIMDAAQLVALAAIEPVRDELVQALGVSERTFNAILSASRAVLPSFLAASVEAPRPANHGLGALPPPQAELEAAEAIPYAVDEAVAVALPPSANLIAGMPEIRDQADRGTCVAFCLTAIHEYALRRGNRHRNLSEQYLYFRTKKIDGIPGQCGTFQASAAEALRTVGQCRETIWPYNPNQPCNQPGPAPARADANAAQSRITLLQLNPKDVNGIKAALAAGRPVGISVPVWQSWYASADTFATGRITMRIGNESGPGGIPAGHCMTAVGYQDSAQYPGGGYFLLRNSWGQDWAARSPYGAGYGTIPYKYISDDNWEAFTLRPPTRGNGSEPDDDDIVIDSEPEDQRRTVTIEVGDITITIV
jgi:hypothetical protein